MESDLGQDDYEVWEAWISDSPVPWTAQSPDVKLWWATNEAAKGAADYVRSITPPLAFLDPK